MKTFLTNPVFIFLLSAFCPTVYANTQSLDAPQMTPIAAYKSELSAKRLLTDIVKVSNKVLAVGERGHIVYSPDGQSWEQANVPVNVLLTGIKFVNDTVGFAIGHDETLLKTMDAGRTWQIVNYKPDSDKPFLNLDVKDKTVIAVGAYGLFWRSDDAGETWDSTYKEALLLEDDRLYLQEIKESDPQGYNEEKQFLLPHFNDITLGANAWYLSGEGGFVAMSADNGNEWTRLETAYYGSYFSVEEYDENEILLAGLRGNAFVLNVETEAFNKLEGTASATINNVTISDGVVYMFANSGNLTSINAGIVSQTSFPDGKAILAGVKWQDKLILATEAGIKSIAINKLVK